MSSERSHGTWLDAWADASTRMFESTVAANRATLAAFGIGPVGSERTDDGSPNGIEPAADLPEWETNSSAEARSELGVGDWFSFTKTLTDEDVHGFALASGDTNPLHLDDAFAEKTRFDGRIVHGTLVGGLISAALARIPGLVVYLSQDLQFRRPVRVGDRVSARCEIVEALGDDQYRLTTRVLSHDDGDDVIIDGEAVVLIDELPE